MPSIRPLIRYWPNRVMSMTIQKAPAKLSLRQLALAARVFAVLPHDPLAVLDDVFGDDRDRVLAMVIERHRADDGVVIGGLVERIAHLRAVGPDLFDAVEDELHPGERERPVRFRWLLV